MSEDGRGVAAVFDGDGDPEGVPGNSFDGSGDPGGAAADSERVGEAGGVIRLTGDLSRHLLKGNKKRIR